MWTADRLLKSGRAALCASLLSAAGGWAMLPEYALFEDFEQAEANQQWEQYSWSAINNNIALKPSNSGITRAYHVGSPTTLKTTFTNNGYANGARPSYFSFYFWAATLGNSGKFQDFSAEINEQYAGSEGHTSTFHMLGSGDVGRFYLNGDLANPVTISGISTISSNNWYHVTAYVDYTTQQVTWRVNATPAEDGGVSRGFMWGTVLGNTVIRIQEDNSGTSAQDGSITLVDDIQMAYSPSISGITYHQSSLTTRYDNTYVTILDRYTGQERMEYIFDGRFLASELSGTFFITAQTSPCFDNLYGPTGQNVFSRRGFDSPNTPFYITAANDHACNVPISGYVANVVKDMPVQVLNASNGSVAGNSKTNVDGTFSASVPFGTYSIRVNNTCFDYFPNETATFTTQYFGPTYWSINTSPKACTVYLTGNITNVGSSATVQVTNTSNGSTIPTVTATNGNYSLSRPFGNYNVVPTSTCYDIDPTSKLVDVNPLGGVADFTGTLKTFTITAKGWNNNANGTVTKSPNSGSYNCGSNVTLTAVPNTGWHFTDWSLDASGPNQPLTLSGITKSYNIEANFAINTYALNVSVSGNLGSVSKNPNASQYNHGAVVSATVSCNSGYVFSSWDDGNTSNPRSFTMTSVITRVATCTALPTYTLNLSSNNTAWGTVSPNGTTSYVSGTSVNISATAAVGYHFMAWSGGITGTNPSATVNMNGNKTVLGTFDINTYSLTASVNGALGTVAKSPNQTNYNHGTNVTLTVTCNSGYQFSSWDDANTSNPRTITMTANTTRTATCSVLPNYTLNLSSNNTAWGTVSPNGTTSYVSGTNVNISATAAIGYHFVNWTGGFTGTSPTGTVNMNGNKTVLGTFAINTYTLTTTVAGSLGSVAKSPNQATYDHGTNVTMTVTCNSGYQFSSWDDANTSNPRTIAMTANTTRTATCAALPNYTLALSSNNSAWGTVSPNGTTSYLSGTSVTLTQAAATGYHFVDWTGSLTSTATSPSVVMDANKTIVGNFAINTYTLTATVTNGTVAKTPNATTYNHGTAVSVAVTCNSGYQFQSWSDGPNSNPRSVTMTGNVSWTGTCTGLPRTLTLSYLNGTITKSPNTATYPHGSTVSLTPVPDLHYVFSKWKIDAGGTANPLGLLMDANKTVEAEFVLQQFALTTSASPTTSGSVTRSPNASTYAYGDEVVVTAVANPGFLFSKWTIDGTQSSYANPYSVTMNKAKTLVAVFTVDKAKLTISPTPVNGSINTQPKPDGSGNYVWGKKVVLTPVPVNGNYKFLGWVGAISGTSVPYALTMDGDKTLSANFGLIPYFTLTINQPANATLKANPVATSYKEGTKVTMSVVLGANATFGNWIIDGVSVIGATKPTYNLVMNANHTVSATISIPPPVQLTVVNYAGTPPVITTTTTTVNQNTAIPISTLIPADKGFSVWEVTSKENGKVSPPITNKTSASLASIKLIGGKATVTAKMADPNLDIWSLDEASGKGDKALSRPRLRIKPKAPASIANIKARYYFKMECSRHPDLTLPTNMNGWTVNLVDADGGTNPDYGGNWYLEFGYSGTLAAGANNDTPQGVLLTYACACGVWDRGNDPSGPKTNKKWVLTRYVPVYLNGGATQIPYPRAGEIPTLQVDDKPEDAPSDKLQEIVPPAPFETPMPQPNVTFDQAFPQGDFIANGSFEMDTVGWLKFGGTGVNWKMMRQTALQGAFDGMSYLQVSPTGGGAEGVFIEIPETNPAFGFLNDKAVTLAARVRRPSEQTGTVPSVKLVLLNGSDNGSGNPACTLNESWQFCTQTFYNLAGTVDAGLKKYRFAVVEATSGQNQGFQVDGVSLTLGEKAAPPVVSSKLTNTRHALMQTRTLIPEENYGYDPVGLRLSVVNNSNDQLGRLSKAYLPYAMDCAGDDCNPAFDIGTFGAQVPLANLQYKTGNAEGMPDAGDVAYFETEYENDQATSVIRTGRAGSQYGILSGNTEETFYSGVSSLSVGELGADFTLPLNRINPIFAYKYVEDENGNGKLEWKNGFGQVVRLAMPVTQNGVEVMAITDNVFDAKGNLIKYVPPVSCFDRDGNPTPRPNCVNPSTFEFDAEDRVTKEVSPDAGTTLSFYDYVGRMRINQFAHQVIAKKFTISKYDELGRKTQVGEYTDKGGLLTSMTALQNKARDPDWPEAGTPEFSDYRIISIYYYDKMPPSAPSEFSEIDPAFRLYPAEMENTFNNSKGRLCAVVTLQNPIQALNDNEESVVDEISASAYKYDKFGKEIETYTFNGFTANPAFKLQKSTSIYDAVGRLSETRNFEKAEDYSATRIAKFQYDHKGRVKEIIDGGGKSIAKYDYYTADGKPKSITLDGDDPDYILIKYSYHINGRIEKLLVERPLLGSAKSIFNENLYYDAPTASGSIPQYNGNLSQATYFLSQLTVGTDGQRQSVYTYDELDRLTKVAYEVLDGTANTKDAQFDAVYSYDENGRILSQRTGSKSSLTSGGEYGYSSGSNRLAFVNDGLGDNIRWNRTGTAADPNFKYDPAGRMVEDRSKKLSVEYDYRGLPLAFSYLESNQLKQIVVRYDHAGARIAKMDFTQNSSFLSNYLVDVDGNRDRDAANVKEAIDKLKSDLASSHSFPGNIILSVVYDAAPFRASLASLGPVKAIPLNDGIHTVSVSIKGLRFNSDDYWATIASRKQMTYASGKMYTGNGNEIRQIGTDPSLTPQVYTNLPLGLGRYNLGTSEMLFNIKNHLGSTVLGVPSNYTFAYDVYDYSAYGKESHILATHTGPDKITEGFTGKELDGSIELQYFGARYFDPELALWISPDPDRQFVSPYSYAPNPLGNFDPDGKQCGGYCGGSATFTTAFWMGKGMLAYRDGLSGAIGAYQDANEVVNNVSMVGMMVSPEPVTKISSTLVNEASDITTVSLDILQISLHPFDEQYVYKAGSDAVVFGLNLGFGRVMDKSFGAGEFDKNMKPHYRGQKGRFTENDGGMLGAQLAGMADFMLGLIQKIVTVDDGTN